MVGAYRAHGRVGWAGTRRAGIRRAEGEMSMTSTESAAAGKAVMERGAVAGPGTAARKTARLFSMKEAGERVGLPYETLKFYCNKGLVPNVKRGANNCRMFDERDIAWIEGLTCLKRCGMSIKEMQEYLALCLEGESSIPARKAVLARKRAALVEQLAEVQASIDYVDWKQGFYDDVLAGRIPYTSNLLPS